MKHYDVNKLINESGFKDWGEVANYLLSEFDRATDYQDKLEIMQFCKSNNIDVIGLVTGEKTVEFYNQPTMTQTEIKQNIEQIADPPDIVPPVDDKVKEIL